MNFVSWTFSFFLIATFAVFYMPWWNGVSQLAILVISSLIFYSWTQPYLLSLLLFSAFVTSFASYLISRERKLWRRRAIASAGVSAMLIVLAFFKYDHLIYNSIVGQSITASGPIRWLLALPLPIGISFYTFHGISLVIDTFSGNVAIDKSHKSSAVAHLSQTILYLTFFPQLIAGPIMKARDFLPQIDRKWFTQIQWDRAIRDLIVGYFLKSVVADNLSVMTALMGGDHAHAPTITLLLMIFGYSCQIFADFAGYSLIAIGLARLFGYSLMTNFNFPYLASSFSEFWRRWHISLSTWLRDYLFIPLGGSRGSKVRTTINIMIVMALGGLWHGAAWSYALWGTAHGIALAVERPFLKSRFYVSSSPVLRGFRVGMVVCLVSFCWLLFRLPNFTDVIEYVSSMIKNTRYTGGLEFLVALAFYSFPVVLYHVLSRAHQYLGPYLRVLMYSVLLFAIVLNSGVPGAFIYFQF
jgi:alginate O-acetyltransferase complex protein AlgI